MNKVVILSDWFYPAYKAGGPITSLTNLVKAIGDKIDVSVLTSAYDLNENEVLDSIVPNVWQKFDNSKIKYLTDTNQVVRELKKEKFDIIYLNSMFSTAFTLKPLLFAKRKKILNKVILAPRGMLAEGALSIKPFKKKLFLKIFKFLAIHHHILFHATSFHEVDDIKKIFGESSKVNMIPNVPSVPNKELFLRTKNKGELKLITVARIAPEKNIKYLLELLKNLMSNISLTIYGMIKTESYFNECKNIIKNLPANVKVSIAKEISSNLIRQKIYENHFFILPTLGENFGHAIYEALSTGTPVIISDKTPWRNLEMQKAGWDIPLTKPEKFIEVLNRCYEMDNEEYQKWSEGAYNFAKKYYEGNNVTEDYLRMFKV